MSSKSANYVVYLKNWRNISLSMSTRKRAKNFQSKDTKIEKASSSGEEQLPVSIDKSKNILIKILAKPGAKQNAIIDMSAEGISVQINAPPTDGEANSELINFISSTLGLRKGDVQLEKGFKSRQKVIKIPGNKISVEDVTEKMKREINI